MPPSVGLWGSNVGAITGLADKLEAVEDVAAVSAMRYATSPISGLGVKGSSGDTSLAVLRIDPITFPQVSALNFQNGDPKQAYTDLAQERASIVNGIFAAQTGVQVGDTVNLSTSEGRKAYRVVGIANDLLNSGKSYFDELSQQFDAVFAVLYGLIGVLALPSLIARLNPLAIGIIERTREIGMLRAVGATRRQVSRTVLAEALSQASRMEIVQALRYE